MGTYGDRNNERIERIMKKQTKSQAKKKAWAMFSKYIRLSHADSYGLVSCYTCGTKMEWKHAQAGHGISGRSNAVLFMIEVVRPQCVGCNVFGRGKQSIFTMKLIQEMGMEEYESLIALSNQIVQYKTVDYQAIEQKYKELFNAYENI